jgi:hypothetical protein
MKMSTQSQGTENRYKDHDDHGPSGKRAGHDPGGRKQGKAEFVQLVPHGETVVKLNEGKTPK